MGLTPIFAMMTSTNYLTIQPPTHKKKCCFLPSESKEKETTHQHQPIISIFPGPTHFFPSGPSDFAG